MPEANDDAISRICSIYLEKRWNDEKESARRVDAHSHVEGFCLGDLSQHEADFTVFLGTPRSSAR